MPDIGYVDPRTDVRQRGRFARRALLMAIVLAAALAGGTLTQAGAAADAASQAGPDLVRLLRGMAVIKAMAAVGLVCAVLWRLAAPIGWGRFGLYAAACAAMAAGPGLIWAMVHVGLGALLLHAGLAASLILLFRDRALGDLLAGAVGRRRARLLFSPRPPA